MHEHRIHAQKAVKVFHQSSGLPEIFCFGEENMFTGNFRAYACVRPDFLRASEQENSRRARCSCELPKQGNVILQRPALERKVLRPARADMKTEARAT